MTEFQAAGLELVNEPVRAAEAFDEHAYGEFAWFRVRAPDGRVYAIQPDSRPSRLTCALGKPVQ